MIPKYIHQTWKTGETPPKYDVMRRSWVDFNPGWIVKLWTDSDLDDFIASHHPDFIEIFRSYPNPVQRADAARYLILHEFGGVYADLDTACLGSFDALAHEERIVFACEPGENATGHIPQRGLDRLIANCVMVSPARHPFWLSVKATMVKCRHARDVLETTGPLLLTGCVEAWASQVDFAISSCHPFNPSTNSGVPSADDPSGPYGGLRLATHYWAGSWFRKDVMTPGKFVKGYLRKSAHALLRGKVLPPAKIQSTLKPALLKAQADRSKKPGPANVAVLMPVRDAERHLDRSLELIRRLDYPKKHMKLVFCEGESRDGTRQKLERVMPELNNEFSSAQLLHFVTRFDANGKPRWHRSLQRKRRSAIAKVRNHLIYNGLDHSDDWALWLDADVVDYPADALLTLLAANADIAVPDCVIESGGRSFDMNSFLEAGRATDAYYYKYVRDGLFQPKSNYIGRRHLHDLRYLNRVPLTGVGGTMLLVRAALHRAGLTFPEIPYKNLIETEGFGKIAVDCGIVPIGLPNLEIRHANE